MYTALMLKNAPGPHHTPASLQAAHTMVTRFMAAFKEELAPLMPSGGCTVKLHKLAHHVIQSIEQLGALVHQSANDFEANFKATKHEWG
jgi:UDP-N-acetylglucosamine enolpyruvyl transferase